MKYPSGYSLLTNRTVSPSACADKSTFFFSAGCQIAYDRELKSRTNEGFQTLTRSGIPTIIPSFHRRAIKDRRDPRLVKFDFSLFSLSNIIVLWPSGRKIPPTTIHVKGYKPGPACVKIFETLMVSASEILLAYCPGYTRLPF